MKNYYILKRHCGKIFLVGSGNYWFEDNTIGDDKSLFYRMYSTLLFFLYSFMTVLEIMAVLIGDFPADEHRDAVTFAVSHTLVLTKMFSLFLKRDLIKELNKKMIDVCNLHENRDEAMTAEKYKAIKVNVVAYLVTVYGSALCFVFEGIRKVLTGSHFVTIVTYYPSFEDNSAAASLSRCFFTVVLFIMMLAMITSADTITVVHLIIYKYKFITLRRYFESLSREVEVLNQVDKKLASERLAQGLIEGIVMHSQVLRLSKDIDKVFGLVIALQLCLSSGSAVTLLLQLALSDNLTFVAGMKVILFVGALFFLLGLFLCNAGEITYQASLLSDAIFYCGWHTCSPRVSRRNVRKIVHLAIMQAQRPLIMKAFKMLELTYGTFLQVVRTTYSVFALFYAQDK